MQMSNLGSQRWISVLVFLVFLSSCTSPRVPIQSGGNGIPEGEVGEQHLLAVGDEVVVVLLDGSEAKGKVIELFSGSIVLGHTSNYGYNETRIEFQSIDHIDLVKVGVNWPVLVVGVVVVAAGLYALFVEGFKRMN